MDCCSIIFAITFSIIYILLHSFNLYMTSYSRLVDYMYMYVYIYFYFNVILMKCIVYTMKIFYTYVHVWCITCIEKWWAEAANGGKIAMEYRRNEWGEKKRWRFDFNDDKMASRGRWCAQGRCNKTHGVCFLCCLGTGRVHAIFISFGPYFSFYSACALDRT